MHTTTGNRLIDLIIDELEGKHYNVVPYEDARLDLTIRGSHLLEVTPRTGPPGILVNTIWQQEKGSAYEKTPMRIIELIANLNATIKNINRGYLILGGKWPGPKPSAAKKFFLDGHLSNAGVLRDDRIKVVDRDDFTALINKRAL